MDIKFDLFYQIYLVADLLCKFFGFIDNKSMNESLMTSFLRLEFYVLRLRVVLTGFDVLSLIKFVGLIKVA